MAKTEAEARKEWYAIAGGKDMTFTKKWWQRKSPFEKFIAKLQGEEMEYGTICVAVAAAGVAAMWAMNRTPQGGITGFQAGCITWEVIREWHCHGEEKPLRLVDWSLMLFPQYEHTFKRELTESTWKWLQEEAAKKLAASPDAHENVLAHWRSIAEGSVPFGYTVAKEEADGNA